MKQCSECPQWSRSGVLAGIPVALCPEHLLKSLEAAPRTDSDRARDVLLRHLLEECEALRRSLDSHIESGYHRDRGDE